ncbi:MAG: hypothetical protein QM726_23140 [Chitinophagaceae bacterium]
MSKSITIDGNKFEGISLGMSNDIPSEIVKEHDLKLEFDKKNSLITISARLIKEFQLNGEKIDFDNFGSVLQRENPLVDFQFYVFDKHNISLYVDWEAKTFLELLLYDVSIKNLYVKEGLRRYNEVILDERNEEGSNIFVFVPYVSISSFKFLESEVSVLNKLGLPLNNNGDIKRICEHKDVLYRFDKGLLTQVVFGNYSKYPTRLLLDSIEINSIEIIETLKKSNKVIERKGYYVFIDLGMAISKAGSFRETEFFFFDKTLLNFWTNVNRPITSW